MFNRINQGMYWDRAWKLVEGCTPISEGCAHCWSARETHMRANHPNRKISERNIGLTLMESSASYFTGQIRLRRDNLSLPEMVKEPTAFAIWNDLFHEDVPDTFIMAAFITMARNRQHTFFVLTKRAERMRRILSSWAKAGLTLREGKGISLPNVWLGVTAEDQEQASERIPLLLQIPVRNRYVSVEPMLGLVDLRIASFNGADSFSSLEGISWVICGGESGPGARPMHPAWVLELLDQCQAAEVPFFLKQMHIDGKLVKTPLLEGKQYLEMPNA